MENHLAISIAQQISGTQAADTLKMLEQVDPVRGEKTADDERLPFRHTNVMVVVAHPGGGFGKCFTHTRYISPTSLSVLSKVFIHAGSKVHVYLPDRVGMPEEREGTVTQCNYIYNSMHEVKINFKDRLNLPLFLDVPAHFKNGDESEIDPEQINGKLLIYSDDAADVRLIMHYLRDTRVHIEQANSLGELLDAIRSKPYDIVLSGEMVQGMRIDRICASLREAGYNSSFMTICVAGNPPPELEEDTLGIHMLFKPLHEPSVMVKFAELLGIGGDDASDCLYSELGNDQDNVELVEWYIDHVKRLAHGLQKAMMADAIDEVRRHIMTLRDTGASYGFKPVSEAAAELLTAINASGSITECQSDIQRCLNMTRRMRCMQ